MSETGRKESCWACKYFAVETATDTDGVCLRKAPTNGTQYMGGLVGVSKVFPPLHMFRSITEGENNFCGDFDQMAGTVPDVPTP